MIVVKNISKHFNNKVAVTNVSFTVNEGETLILLGTSGCGKTTTLKMINRLIEPSAGEILVNGTNILTGPPEHLRRSIGYVLQNNGLFPHYTVAQNIAVVPHLLKWPKSKIEERTKELLLKLQLPFSVLHAYPNQLSGGQQQRVGLARALAADPPILLMDEPFGALDPITRTDIRKEFSQLDELKRKTIVMVTHDIQEAFELGNHICLMSQGQIMQIGTPATLLFNPANSFVHAFFNHQRFQLQLAAISIQAIWPQLNNTTAPSGNLTNLQSLWEALEEILQHKTATVAVTHTQSGEVKSISYADVITALNHYKA